MKSQPHYPIHNHLLLCFLYALWKSQENLAGLLVGCFVTFFSLLAFGVTYIKVWYLLWPLAFAILIPSKRTYLAAFLISYGALLVEMVDEYIWPWGGLSSWSTFAIVNSVVYLVFFFPTILLGLVHFFASSRIAEKFQQKQTGAHLADATLEPAIPRLAGDDTVPLKALTGNIATGGYAHPTNSL